MSETVRRRVTLTMPRHLADQPILFRMACDHNLVPCVRAARLDEKGGEVVLDLEGAGADLDQGLAYLRGEGVVVTIADEEVGG